MSVNVNELFKPCADGGSGPGFGLHRTKTAEALRAFADELEKSDEVSKAIPAWEELTEPFIILSNVKLETEANVDDFIYSTLTIKYCVYNPDDHKGS